MARQSISGSFDLAKKIRSRRNELGLTIEEAASRAGVGMKTWSRYEAGESIRADKAKGICKALNWKIIPGQEDNDSRKSLSWEREQYEAWSPYLEREYGVIAARTFALGSDLLLDGINEDMAELASRPVGTHIGQIGVSWLIDELPEQFLMNYNYEFLHLMKCTLKIMRMRARDGYSMVAHSVLEELILYLCCEEAEECLELSGENEDDEDFDEEWLYDLLGDMDIITCLYGIMHLEEDHVYHFSHWKEQQFYVKNEEEGGEE